MDAAPCCSILASWASLGSSGGRCEGLGLEPGQVKAILLTHGHLDHAGNLAWAKAWSGAPVYAHAAEQAHIDGTFPYRGINRWCGRLERAGAPCWVWERR
jgi:glyoxylase-like metal-dependent hydrolase (beta-lactamase superfamily II)